MDELKRMNISCTNGGCNWNGPSSEYKAHKEVCPFAFISCPHQKYGCPKKIAHNALSDHAATCAFKPSPCQWCSTLMENEEVQ